MSRVHIYTPTYHRFEKTKRSIETIIESINNSKHDTHLYIGDNNSPLEMKKWLLDQETEKIHIYLNSKNIGKAATVNFLHAKYPKCDFVSSIDSDMLAVHNSEYNWIDDMVEILEKDSTIGLLSCFQEGATCHKTECLYHEIKLKVSREQSVKHGFFGGIAGGCLMMRQPEFNAISGYTVIDVYNGDDALLLRKVHEKLQKLVCVTMDIKLVHPVNDQDEAHYQEWKTLKALGKIPNGAGTKGFFDT
jgi:GT2 family glycosyltransferase